MSYYAINYSKLRIWEQDDILGLETYKLLTTLTTSLTLHQTAICSGGWTPPVYFNAAMFVFEPKLSIYYNLLETVQATPPTMFAEKDFLNMYFRDIYKPIPPIYNLVLAMLWRHPESIDLDQVEVVHYCAAGSKPWRYTGKEENMDREDIKLLVKKCGTSMRMSLYNINTARSNVAHDSTGRKRSAATNPSQYGNGTLLNALSEAGNDDGHAC